jgi:transcriptional antiterminator NusG
VTEENETVEETADTNAEAPAEETASAEAVAPTEDAEDAAPSEETDVPAPPVDDGIKRRWYAIHAYSGQEGNVQKMLQIQADYEGVGDMIGEVLVPMEEVAEIKSGEKKISKRKFFPGYVLARLPEHPEHNAELWHAIKTTPGVAGFIGSKTAPTPLDDGEVQAIIEEMRGERERPKPKVNFEQGERVKIIDGPFANFLGNIDEINGERGTLKVMVEIFERSTSVEVEFWQVEKM